MGSTDGWRITGYYLPASGDFHGRIETIQIHRQKISLPSHFLSKVKMEGWGLITGGNYLGWSNHQWVLNNDPLNAVGTALHIGSLAVDPTVIPLGTNVTIPSAPPPWNTRMFVADDTGGAIKGRHVDIYCGAGRVAEVETNRVTSNNGTVHF